MEINVYNTHIEVFPYHKNDYPSIEQMYECEDKFTGDIHPCGYTILDGKLYLPRGTPVSRLESILGVQAHYVTRPDKFSHMAIRHYALYDPRDELQEQSIEFLKGPEHQLSLNLATGLGKGNFESTPIPTPDGWTTMGEIHVGSTVFGLDGKPEKVTAVYHRGLMDVYEVLFDDGRTARCSKDHLWMVYDRSGQSKVMPLEEIMADYKTYDDEMDTYRFKYDIPLITNPVEYALKPVPLDPYLVGVLIAAGNLRESMLTITADDDYVPIRFSRLAHFRGVVRSPANQHMYQFVDHKLSTKGRPFKVHTPRFLKDLPDLLGMTWATKRIPDVYMYNSEDIRLRLLQGLLDANGSVAVDDSQITDLVTIQYASFSRTILEQIQELIRGLGYICYIDPYDSKTNAYRDGYGFVATIRAPTSVLLNLFTHPGKRRLINAVEHPTMFVPYLRIKSIRQLGQEECICIKVDNPNHLYLCDQFIVTHNTYCVCNAVSQLGIRSIIITPNDAIKQQWIQTLSTMFDYTPSTLMNIAGSNIIRAIMDDELPLADVYVVNHQTIHSYMAQTSPYQFHRFIKKLRVGIKVYDESHLDFANILLIDFFSNTDRTWYLTATFDRSDKGESKCFQQAFRSVVDFGAQESRAAKRRHVIYHVVNINSRISQKNRAALMGYPGFTATKYAQYAFFKDPSDTCYNTIKQILELTKDLDGKTAIFVALIDAVDDVVRRLKIDFPDKTCAAYHSKVPKDEKDSAASKDIIVSTIKSLGTGADIKGLRVLISAEAIASKVLLQQTLGRLREYAPDKDTYYFDIVDRSIPPCTYWFNARMRAANQLAKKVVNLEMN